MADPPSPGISPRNSSLRRRGLPTRTTLETIPDSDWPQRRNSTLSDTISEARHSIRSSTDDLFLPRVSQNNEGPIATEESHWHSAPLALALLPAIAGVMFKEGSVFVTDVTLLVLAAIFLNWSVRLPWDWYRSAQAITREESTYSPTVEGIEPEAGDEAVDSGEEPHRRPKPPRTSKQAAIKELHIHELVALASCFIFPLIGTWLLHGIRCSLSRPSEGLVSNYNLTIFLLASEIRPFAHLLKLFQARTLHLQRIIATTDDNHIDSVKVQDLTTRLEELEAHVAEAAATRLASSPGQNSPKEPNDAQSLITQAVAEARKALQPDIEALNRAVRRYEKRTALITLQTDTRFQQLEAQTRDALALAAAAQRSSLSRRSSYAFTLVDWACACIVVPAQLAVSILNLPSRAVNRCLATARSMIGRQPSPQSRSKSSKGKSVQGTGRKVRPRSPPPKALGSTISQPQSISR
ncbi:hypothetical protein N7466_000901 [Penicillium verhagenii]|uniref:uncharacterized protein n=1 Tax=Penicillium verhagenii TaxID=1562060 RepID=UPI0025450EB0|nr:uncharacterized protein N7466_000901 [Penicillium verhagenii]KAJ5947886.1 hypothetical protein N7466_000901 [Penicillium verhagenii]